VLDLNAVVSETDRLLTRLLGEDIERVCDLDPTLGRVNADPRQMEQALLNLVINARDAMPAGGRLTIASRNVAVDEAFANENPDIPPGDYIMLSVTDTGYGMDDQVKSHLFEPFFTTKEESKGTGLGLAIVYGFIAQSGGHLRVQSKPGCGSTFKIYLPRVDDVTLRPTSVRLPSVRPTAVRLAPLGPAAPAGTSNAVRGTETVLLVEDDEAIGALGKLVLQTIGYTVLQAGDGLQALQISEQHPGTIHLLVTDVVMPNMSGRQLAQRLVQSRPALKVLFMSGHPNEIILEDSAPSARTDFLPKPFTLVALENTVRAVLDG
jgi:CheY-like chemotaxis protein